MPAPKGDSVHMEKPEWLGRMETVLEVLNEGVVIADDRHRILFANSRFVEMTGIPLEDLVGFDASRFYSSEEWNFLTQQIEIAFHAGHNRYAFVLPRKDGSRLPVIISSRTLENDGARLGIVTFADISEQVHAEEELHTATARDIESLRDLSQRHGDDNRATQTARTARH
jgi:PAS domain S-box-containing protein